MRPLESSGLRVLQSNEASRLGLKPLRRRSESALLLRLRLLLSGKSGELRLQQLRVRRLRLGRLAGSRGAFIAGTSSTAS